MFRTSLAHPQEALHEHSFGGCSSRLFTGYGWTVLTIPRKQSTSITACYTHQNCVRVVPPEDGQVMPETCRGFEF
jgi:hypothetical protein